ncbi:hypothetical protein [Gallaecimonas mangrovi]|uniref:hypothetical protein n=1 Tax=Gallaecimonas mangrovi TaxID=2291597 RepID=UPI000E2004E7|nr:hypothetical protein [Gallaecimonas mangrovi]
MADRLFDDYFSVRLACEVHLDWLSDDAAIPDAKQLADELPPLRRQLDLIAEQEQMLWAELKDERQSPQARLLDIYRQKLDLLADQVLTHSLGEQQWHKTVHFSAGGFSINKEAAQGQIARVVLRMPIGQIQGYVSLAGQDEELAYFQYVTLLEPDRERLVRLALQTQSDQLRARRERHEEKS